VLGTLYLAKKKENVVLFGGRVKGSFVNIIERMMVLQNP